MQIVLQLNARACKLNSSCCSLLNFIVRQMDVIADVTMQIILNARVFKWNARNYLIPIVYQINARITQIDFKVAEMNTKSTKVNNDLKFINTTFDADEYIWQASEATNTVMFVYIKVVAFEDMKFILIFWKRFDLIILYSFENTLLFLSCFKDVWPCVYNIIIYLSRGNNEATGALY